MVVRSIAVQRQTPSRMSSRRRVAAASKLSDKEGPPVVEGVRIPSRTSNIESDAST